MIDINLRKCIKRNVKKILNIEENATAMKIWMYI